MLKLKLFKIEFVIIMWKYLVIRYKNLVVFLQEKSISFEGFHFSVESNYYYFFW